MRRRRRPDVLLALAAWALVCASGNGLLVLLALLTVGVLALRRWLPTASALALVGTGAVSGATLVGLISGWAHLHLLGSRWQTLIVLTPLVAAAAWIASSRPPRRRWRRPTCASVAAHLPSVLCLGVALSNAVSVDMAGRWFALIMDPVNHAHSVRDLRESGALTFEASTYPRGAHALVAMTATAAGQSQDLATQISTAAAVTWLSAAFCIYLLTCTAMHLTPTASWPRRELAGAATGLLLLVPSSFVLQFILFGAYPSLIAIGISVLPALLALEAGRGRLLWLWVSVPVLGAALTSLWTATALGAATAGVWLAWVTVRRRRALRPTRWQLALVAAACALALVVAVPQVLALLADTGLGTAGIFGRPRVPSTPVLVIGAIGVLALVRQRRRPGRQLMLAIALGYLAMAGLLQLVSGHVGYFQQWYPVKAFWFFLVLAVAAGAGPALVLTEELWRRLGLLTARLGPAARVARASVVALAVTGFVLLNSDPIWLYLMRDPAILVPVRQPGEYDGSTRVPSYGQISSRSTNLALTYADRYAPAVTVPLVLGYDVWDDTSATYTVSRIMSLQTGQQSTHGELSGVCADVRSAAGDRPAVIVTGVAKAYTESLAADQGCAGVRVVRAPVVTGHADRSSLDERLTFERELAERASSG